MEEHIYYSCYYYYYYYYNATTSISYDMTYDMTFKTSCVSWEEPEYPGKHPRRNRENMQTSHSRASCWE